MFVRENKSERSLRRTKDIFIEYVLYIPILEDMQIKSTKSAFNPYKSIYKLSKLHLS